MATLTTNQLAIAGLYTALLNRAPDAVGFTFWLQALDAGASVDTIAQSMLNAPETAALYPPGSTSAQFVAAYYTNVFGRAPDPDGLAFWSAALDALGGADSIAARAALATRIGEIVSVPLASQPEGMSDATYAQTVADRARFANKVEFGVRFAVELKRNDLTLAKSALALITDDPASLQAATDVANGVVPPKPGPGPQPEPLLAITAADSATDIAAKFAASSRRSPHWRARSPASQASIWTTPSMPVPSAACWRYPASRR